MNDKTLKTVLDYLEFILSENEEHVDEIYSSESVSLVPGILWGIFSIIVRLFNDNVINKKEMNEVMNFIESLLEKYPKVTQKVSLIRQATDKLKSLV